MASGDDGGKTGSLQGGEVGRKGGIAATGQGVETKMGQWPAQAGPRQQAGPDLLGIGPIQRLLQAVKGVPARPVAPAGAQQQGPDDP